MTDITQTQVRDIFAKHIEEALAEIDTLIGPNSEQTLPDGYKNSLLRTLTREDFFDNLVADCASNLRRYLLARALANGKAYKESM